MKIDYPRAHKRGLRRYVPSWRLVLGLGALGVVLLAGLFALGYVLVKVPSPSSISLAQSAEVFYADGKTPLGVVGARNRESVSLSQVPVPVQHAVLAAEDRSFYSEPAVSPTGVMRAALVDLRHGDFVEGGSTITQQYVKNAFLTQQRTMTRKLKEFFISIKIGNTLSKNDILQNYLNTIYFGRGAYGIQAAAKAYFGKDVSALTPAEGAVLAASIQAPSYLDPARHLMQAQQRWKYVLDGMVKKGWMSAPDRAAATYPTDLAPLASSSGLGGPNGYLVATVESELESQGISENQVNRGGLRIVTTFDPGAEAAAIAAVTPVRAKFPPFVREAVVSVQPGTGKVLAMYGGPDYVTEPFDDVTQASPQMGSTFKPYVLAAALQAGLPLSTTFNGTSPQKIDGTTYVNDSGERFGRINLVTATARSVNTVYVQLGEKVGLDRVINAAHDAGLPKSVQLDKNGSMLLGSGSAHPLDQAAAYATFAAGGRYAQPYVVQTVTDAHGHVIYAAKPHPRQVFSAAVAADVSYALQQVVRSGTGKAAAIGRPVAGKTGTTSKNTAAWFVGYTPQMSTAVAMFAEDNRSLQNVGGLAQVYGGTAPATLWATYMKVALAHAPRLPFPPPANVGVPKSAPPSSPSAAPTSATAAPKSLQASIAASAPGSASPTSPASPTASASSSNSTTPSPSARRSPTPGVTPQSTPTPPLLGRGAVTATPASG